VHDIAFLPFVLSFFGCLWMKSPIVGFRN
jgi:hypothetical protein